MIKKPKLKVKCDYAIFGITWLSGCPEQTRLIFILQYLFH